MGREGHLGREWRRLRRRRVGWRWLQWGPWWRRLAHNVTRAAATSLCSSSRRWTASSSHAGSGSSMHATKLPPSAGQKRETPRGRSRSCRAAAPSAPRAGTTTSRPSGAFAASSGPTQAASTDRARRRTAAPAPGRSPTGSRSAPPAAWSRATARQPTARPLPSAVARSDGRPAASVSPATARATVRPRAAEDDAVACHSGASSAHSADSWRPWSGSLRVRRRRGGPPRRSGSAVRGSRAGRRAARRGRRRRTGNLMLWATSASGAARGRRAGSGRSPRRRAPDRSHSAVLRTPSAAPAPLPAERRDTTASAPCLRNDRVEHQPRDVVWDRSRA